MLVGLLVAVALTVASALLRRAAGGARPLMRAAARRLGGRLDPASESSQYPAILVELDGHLLRAVGWPVDFYANGAEPPPFLEVCTPVEGVAAPIRIVRRSVLTRLLPLLSEDLRKTADADVPEAGISIFGAHHAAWAPALFEAHPSWILLELDYGTLRVLTQEPQQETYGAEAVAGAVRNFASTVPEILLAAGVTRSSHLGGRGQ